MIITANSIDNLQEINGSWLVDELKKVVREHNQYTDDGLVVSWINEGHILVTSVDTIKYNVYYNDYSAYMDIDDGRNVLTAHVEPDQSNFEDLLAYGIVQAIRETL